MNIIRQYKIHLIFNCLTEKEISDLNTIFKFIEFHKKNYDLIDFIYNNLLNLKEIHLDEYPNHIFWFNEDRVILEYYPKKNYVGVRYNIFPSESYQKTQENNFLIKKVLMEFYKINDVVVERLFTRDIYFIEDSYRFQINEYNKKI